GGPPEMGGRGGGRGGPDWQGRPNAMAFGNGRRDPRLTYNGNASFSLDNSVWDARTFSVTGANVAKPVYANGRGSVMFGGPLRIPKLVSAGKRILFTFDYQAQRNRPGTISDPVNMPTALERGGAHLRPRDRRAIPRRQDSRGPDQCRRDGVAAIFSQSQSGVRDAQLSNVVERAEQLAEHQFTGLEYQDRQPGYDQRWYRISGQQQYFAEPVPVHRHRLRPRDQCQRGVVAGHHDARDKQPALQLQPQPAALLAVFRRSRKCGGGAEHRRHFAKCLELGASQPELHQLCRPQRRQLLAQSQPDERDRREPHVGPRATQPIVRRRLPAPAKQPVGG